MLVVTRRQGGFTAPISTCGTRSIMKLPPWRVIVEILKSAPAHLGPRHESGKTDLNPFNLAGGIILIPLNSCSHNGF